MNRLNPEKFLREIDKSLELIEEDFSKSGTISKEQIFRLQTQITRINKRIGVK